MHSTATHSTATRALAMLPTGLQSFCRNDKHNDREELVSALWLHFLKARPEDSLETIYRRARSECRRFTQDLSHYSKGFEEGDRPAPTEPTPCKRKDYVRRIAEERGVTLRRAQQIVKQMLADAERQHQLPLN